MTKVGAVRRLRAIFCLAVTIAAIVPMTGCAHWWWLSRPPVTNYEGDLPDSRVAILRSGRGTNLSRYVVRVFTWEVGEPAKLVYSDVRVGGKRRVATIRILPGRYRIQHAQEMCDPDPPGVGGTLGDFFRPCYGAEMIYIRGADQVIDLAAGHVYEVEVPGFFRLLSEGATYDYLKDHTSGVEYSIGDLPQTRRWDSDWTGHVPKK